MARILGHQSRSDHTYALSVEGVTKKFHDKGKDFYALRNVSFNIKRGEIFGLLGPNGAGKTTLINSIIGILTPDKGDIKMLGESNRNRAIFDRVNGIAAETHFHWVMRPTDILRFYGKIYGVPKKILEPRIEKLMDMFDIKRLAKSKYGYLSTGERARVQFAKCLINNPELLLLDEPTLGLDPNMAARARKMIKMVNKEQKITVLLTSHYMQEVELLANRVGFINKGQIVDIGTVSKVKLKHFSTYDLLIKPAVMPSAHKVKSLGFAIKGKYMFKEMKTKEDLSVILSSLHKKDVAIKDVKVKRPTLEDYFIKLAKRE